MHRATANGGGRPRTFDAEAALDAAMNVFWEHGYEGATYLRLEAATGLHRQSLVYAFGDKPTLFRKVLDRYAECQVARVLKALQKAGSGWNRIARTFGIWEKDAGNHVSRGCLFVNTATMPGPLDPGVMTRLTNARHRVIEAFESAISDAQLEGTIRKDLDHKALARHALALGDGVMLHARMGMGRQYAATILRSFLKSIRPETIRVQRIQEQKPTGRTERDR
jgi:TetR/AcrR family transcriptional regulator, transcriptional repressor for nem operon